MRLMNVKRVVLVLSIMTIGIAPIATAAPSCNVRGKVSETARVFARISEHSAWHEYRSLDAVPELRLDSGMSAQFWQDRHHRGSVYIIEPGQDFWTYTRYCFDGDGELEGVSFEIRTPLGWGHRAEGPVLGGGFDASTQGFFSLKNGKAIARPEGVGDVPDELQPTLYRTVSELPFAQLLTVAADSARHAK